MMNKNLLFSDGDLADFLSRQLREINGRIARWGEDDFLSTPGEDIREELRAEFLVEPLSLDPGAIVVDSVKEGSETVIQFDERVQLRRSIVTISMPFTGDPQLFKLTTSTRTWSPPSGTARGRELKLYYSAPCRLPRERQWFCHQKRQPVEHGIRCVRVAYDEVRAVRADRSDLAGWAAVSVGFARLVRCLLCSVGPDSARAGGRWRIPGCCGPGRLPTSTPG